ncbi:MAG TPA: zf-HC2 domain-containing protein [Acidimicrobiales bacterium]|jgi:predicted anti-sigma-YlaC factor YlaD
MNATAYVCKQFVEDVTAYLEGALPDDVVARIDEHLADCPHCREYLRQMQLTVEMSRDVATDVVGGMPDDVREQLLRAFRERHA